MTKASSKVEPKMLLVVVFFLFFSSPFVKIRAYKARVKNVIERENEDVIFLPAEFQGAKEHAVPACVSFSFA